MSVRSLDPVREEVARALSDAIPAVSERMEAVDLLFQGDERAPYSLALEALSGREVPSSMAAPAWTMAIELRHRWTRRLAEPVTLRAAAAEALSRHMSGDCPVPDPGASSLRPYLDRDMVTGLFHKLHFSFRLAAELRTAERTGQPVSLIHVDMFGLAAAAPEAAQQEDLCHRIGEVLRRHFRASDAPCRLSDETFAVILPATPLAASRAMAEEANLLLQRALPEDGVSVSIGVAASSEGVSARLLQRAAEDAARRAAMQGGGTAVAFYFAPASSRSRVMAG